MCHTNNHRCCESLNVTEVLGFIITIEESAVPGFFLFILRRRRGAQEVPLEGCAAVPLRLRWLSCKNAKRYR